MINAFFGTDYWVGKRENAEYTWVKVGVETVGIEGGSPEPPIESESLELPCCILILGEVDPLPKDNISRLLDCTIWVIKSSAFLQTENNLFSGRRHLSFDKTQWCSDRGLKARTP